MQLRLVGVIHLAPLPGSPEFDGAVEAVTEGAARDAERLEAAGFDGAIVENFGDAPFCPGAVEPVTVAAMTRCALAAGRAAPRLALGVNLLRNDAAGALAVAAATDARFVRINVHVGARVTDQGVVEGRAHDTLRARRALGLDARVRLFCDVAVKHSAPLALRPLAEEVEETASRGRADAVLITGSGTGRGASGADLDTALDATDRPVYVASGATPESLPELLRERGGRRVAGVIAGSWLRTDGRAGGPIDPERARRLADAFHAACR